MVSSFQQLRHGSGKINTHADLNMLDILLQLQDRNDTLFKNVNIQRSQTLILYNEWDLFLTAVSGASVTRKK